jgi:single-stranded DNA-binding protein
MAGSYNKIILIGNVGRDPQEYTTWFRVTAFAKLAETCYAFLRKGS